MYKSLVFGDEFLIGLLLDFNVLLLLLLYIHTTFNKLTNISVYYLTKVFFASNSFKSYQIKSLLLSHHHSTCALVSEILGACSRQCRNNLYIDSTYLQTYTDDMVQHTQTYTQCTQCTILTVINTHYTPYVHILHYITLCIGKNAQKSIRPITVFNKVSSQLTYAMQL